MEVVGRLLRRWPPDGQAVYASQDATPGETWRAWSSNGGNVFVLTLAPTDPTSTAAEDVGVVLSYSHLWAPKGPPRLSGWRALFDAEATAPAAARVLRGLGGGARRPRTSLRSGCARRLRSGMELCTERARCTSSASCVGPSVPPQRTAPPETERPRLQAGKAASKEGRELVRTMVTSLRSCN